MMAAEPLPPREVVDFRFCEMRRLQITGGGKPIPQDAVNLITSSSRYGLIFAAFEEGFKVIRLEDILDLNEDIDNMRNVAEEYPCQVVNLPSAPVLLALSSDDLTLAVCLRKDGSLFADMYDIRTFADQDATHQPFTSILLSSNVDVKLNDLVWNPVTVEIFAFCLSDGSVAVHELTETSLKIIGILSPQTGATAVCWSPKGKQLVVGKCDGSFAQYKPTLQEVKSIPSPKLMENAVSVLKIQWLSTTLFAIAYVSCNDKTPNLVLSLVQKGGNVSFTNYGDICFGNEFQQEPRYWMYHQPDWGILLCASSSALETGVLGSKSDDKITWEQWILEGTGRAEMPLINNEETFPLGISIISCAQRKIIISETVSYPPMPIILEYSTTGLLCPFHMLNTFPGASNLINPSDPLPREGERKPNDKLFSPIATLPPKPLLASTPMNGNNAPLVHKIPVENSEIQKTNLMKIFKDHKASAPSLQEQTPKLQIFNSDSSVGQGFLRPPIPSTVAFPQQTQNTGFVFSGLGLKAPVSSSSAPALNSVSETSQPATVLPSTTTCHLPASTSTSQPTIFQPTALKTVSTTTVGQPVSTRPAPLKPFTLVQKPSSEGTKIIEGISDDTYTSAVLDEIAEFSKELQELKERIKNCQVKVGTEEEMAQMRRSTHQLSEFCTDMKKTMKAINTEVNNLKNLSLETYAMIEEARSRDIRNKDIRYLSLLRSRALDPLNARKLQDIRVFKQYIETQLREVHHKLDHDWNEFLLKQKKFYRRNLQLSSSEAIYRAILNNQNFISTLQDQIDQLLTVVKNKTMNQPGKTTWKPMPRMRLQNPKEELSALADILLHAKISSPSSVEEKSSRFTPKKVLSSEKQALLKEMLLNRGVVHLKPTVIKNLSQSRLTSSIVLSNKESEEKLSPEAGNIGQLEKSSVEANNDPLEEKDENSASSEVSEAFQSPESSSQYMFPLKQVPVLSFTPKLVSQAGIGGITSGAPISTTLNRPIPGLGTNQIPTNECDQPKKPLESKEATGFPINIIKGTQSAFTNISLPPNKQFFSEPQPHMMSTPKPEIEIKLAQPAPNFLPQAPVTTTVTMVTSMSVGGSHTTTKSVFSSASQSQFQFGANLGKQKPNETSSTFFTIGTKSPFGSLSFNVPNSGTTPGKPSTPPSFSFTPPERRRTFKPVQRKDKAAGTSGYENITPPDTPQPIAEFPEDGEEDGDDEEVVNAVTEEEKAESSECGIVSSSVTGSPPLPPVESTSSTVIVINLSNNTVSKVTQPQSKSIFTFPASTSVLSTQEKQFVQLSETNDNQQPTSSDAKSTGFFTLGRRQSNSDVTSTTVDATEAKLAAVTTAIGTTATSIVPTLDTTTTSPANGFSFKLPASLTTAPTFGFDGKPSAKETSPFVETLNKPATSVSAQSSTTSVFGKPATKPLSTHPSSPVAASSEALDLTSSECEIVGQIDSNSESSAHPPTTTTTGIPVQSSASAPSVFSLPAATTPSTSPFVSAAAQSAVTTSPLFGQVTSSPTSVFGQAAAEASPVFGQSKQAVFNVPAQAAATSLVTSPDALDLTTSTSGFLQVSSAISTTSVSQSPSEQTVPSSGVFGQPAASSSSIPTPATSATPTTTAPSFFGQSNASSPFMNKSIFGQSPSGNNAGFGQQLTFGKTSFFGATSPGSGNNSIFGQQAPPSTSSETSMFGQSTTTTSGFTFGQPSSFAQGSSAFGQNSPSFGMGGTSLFGKSTSASPSFGQGPTSPTGGGFFGQNSGFFSGLGGKPSAENADKNVFANAASFGSPTQSNNLFGNQGASAFGSKMGSFSGGNFSTIDKGGSVAQTGFGSFQQTPPKTGGFGSPPAFGGGPTFGGNPTFGGSPSFGSGATFSPPPPPPPSVGANTFAPSSSTGFGGFASNSAPSFGALAAQGPTFGNINQPSQTPTFGTGGNGFGSAGFGNASFGQAPSFGGQSPGGSSAFTQWR